MRIRLDTNQQQPCWSSSRLMIYLSSRPAECDGNGLAQQGGIVQMVPGNRGKGGRGELHQGAVLLPPNHLHPLHVPVEWEQVEQEVCLVQLLHVNVYGIRDWVMQWCGSALVVMQVRILDPYRSKASIRIRMRTRIQKIKKLTARKDKILFKINLEILNFL